MKSLLKKVGIFILALSISISTFESVSIQTVYAVDNSRHCDGYHTITCDPNGGTIIGNASITYRCGDGFGPLPRATRKGYSTDNIWRAKGGQWFAWAFLDAGRPYTSADFAWYANNAVIYGFGGTVPAHCLTSNTLICNWTANTYYVDYAKGSTNKGGSTGRTTHRYDSNVTLANNGFIGRSYSIKFDGNKPSNASHNVTNIPSNQEGNLTFKYWSVSATQNSGNYNAGVNLGVKNFEYNNGATAHATAVWNSKTVNCSSQPKLQGWTFMGWSTNKNASSGSYTVTDTIDPATTEYTKTYYAIWKPNEYNIYYEKGLTTDVTHSSITGATRDTNIQSSGTNRPYTHVIYDSSTTLARISPVIGRDYQLTFDSNKPISIPNQLVGGDAEPTTVDGINGVLSSANVWQITGQDSDVYANLRPTMGSNLVTNYTATNNGSVNAIAQWNNKTLNNFISPTLDGWSFMGWYDNQAGNNSTAVDNSLKKTTVNTTANMSADSNVKVYGNITDFIVKPYTTKFEEKLYARWQRTITLTFNLNGGQYLGKSDPIVLTGIYYNNADGYNFKLDGTLTPAKLPDYEKQISSFKINGTQKGIDAYGTYDTNGENNKYTLIKDDGTRYRFLGWSTNPSATEPDTDFIVYSDSHRLEYRLYHSLTLYAVWEPVLTTTVHLYRTLGELTFSDGSTPKTSVSGVKASDGLQQLQVIAKPGEQCGYTIALTGNNDAKVGIQFDTKITDIYNHQGTWTDNLNPSTEEDLISNQNHGLDRNIQLSNKTATRKFYIPQYLGTDKSYITSQGIKVYTADMLLQQDSYYYKGLGTKEEIPIHITIYLTTDPTGKPKPTPTPDNPTPNDPDPIISVLDELRTKLKIRLK